MQVTAFSTAARPEWRWRICDYGGETIEESHDRFLTIAAAVAQGAERLTHMNAVDRARAARGDSTSVRSAGAAPASPVRSMSPRSDLGAEPHAQSAGATAEIGSEWRLPVKQRLNSREPQSC